MSEHFATIAWKCDSGGFIDRKYSREHRWMFDGGVEVSASASPHVVPVPYANPACVDPEEAFVASLASCHMLWFLDIAAKSKFVVERYTDCAIGVMEKNQEGKLAMTQVRLRPNIIFAGDTTPTTEQIAAIHEEAHQSCFIANSVKTEVMIEMISL